MTDLTPGDLKLIIFCLNVYWEQNVDNLDDRKEIDRCERIELLTKRLEKEYNK